MHAHKFKVLFLEILTDAKISGVDLFADPKIVKDVNHHGLLEMPATELGLRKFKKRWVRI